MGINSSYIIDFSSLYKFESDEIGKKAHQIGALKHLGIPIPGGFVVIYSTNLSQDLIREIHKAYKKLSGIFWETSVNIFTSHLGNRSLVFPNVKGDANLIHEIKKIWTSDAEKPLTIIIQKNIKSKLRGKLSAESDIAKKIQKHFYFPQEVNYVIEKGKIYITAVKYLTIIPDQKQIWQNKIKRKIIIRGTPVNPGIVTGPVKILRNQDYYRVKVGEIAVIPQLDKLLYSKVARAKAIIADSTLVNSYDKMIYRNKIKNPTIMGAKNALKVLRNGNIVTVNGLTGEIYSGGII